MSAPLGMYGGYRYESPENRALGSITDKSFEDSYGDQGELLAKMTGDISFMAAQLRKTQQAADKANENVIQQLQDLVNDFIVLLGGGSLQNSGLDLGDLKYVLIAIGALLGIGDGQGNIQLPINLVNAAWHFFQNYILQGNNFQQVIDAIIDGWNGTVLDLLGEIPIVGQAAEQLAAFLSDIRDLLDPIAAAVDTFLNSFGLDSTNGSGISNFFTPLKPIFDSLTTALNGINLPDFTPMFHAFAQWGEPFVQLVAEVINAFAPLLNDVVTMSGDVITPVVQLITPVIQALAPILDMITAVVTALNPFLDAITGVISMFGFGSAPTGFDPTSAISDLITNWINPSGLLAAIGGMDWAGLVSSFIPGFSGGTQANFTTIASNLLSMLGNPTGLNVGGFDPIAAVQQFAQLVGVPAGLLSSNSMLPLHGFGGLTASSGALTNVLANADPGFDSPATLNGAGLWTHDATVGRTVLSSIVGSAKTTANSTLNALIGVPVQVSPDTKVTVGTYVRWQNLSSLAGNMITLAVEAFDANGGVISNPTGRIVKTITDATVNSSSYAGADAQGWVNLQSGYTVPAGASYICLTTEVGAVVSAGTIWVDDNLMQLPGLVDATLLHNFENMTEGVIPGPAMAGFQGLVNIFESFSHLVDGLGTASSLSPQSGLDFSDLFGFIQDLATNADQGGTQGAINTNILNIRTNKLLSAGMHPTSESMHPLSSFGTAGAMTTTSLAAGNAIGQPFRAGEVAKKGFFEFIASGTGVTNIFVNIFSVDPTTGNKTILYASTDQSSSVQTALAPVKVLIPGASQPTANAGSNWYLEIVNAGSAALTVVTKNTGQPTHPTDFPYNIGTTRVLASTGGASPSTLTNAQVTRTSNTPYINLGMQVVPNNFVPPQIQQFSTNGTWARPGGFVDGDLVDVFILGGGGGGQSGGYGLAGSGGQAGQWRLQTFVIGSDPNGTGYPVLPNTTTTLAIVCGAGGGGGVNPYTLDPGRVGQSSTVSGTGITTLTAAGGLGGGNGYTGSGTSGQEAGNRTIGAYTAYGGPQTAVNANGPGEPGAGGSSGYPAFGNNGGHGHVWIRTKQASSQ